MSPREVYIVTSGSYSDYGISSVWLTREQAEADAGTWGRVEVWPIGENRRTLGTFSHSAQINYVTGEVDEDDPSDFAGICTEPRASVICWPGSSGSSYRDRLGIRVASDTQERADKVYSETKARVLAEISMGLPMEVIADQKYVGGRWVSTRRAST